MGETTAVVTAPATTTRAPVGRLASIDQVRGLVIALMVLDHVRVFFATPAISPTDLEQTSVGLFLTRWVTHYCAPIFVFLAGTSARLSSSRLSRTALTRFMFQRGLWLVALEFTVVSLAWSFNFDYRMGLVLQVIWVLGASMCVLAALVWLPIGAVGALGALLVVGHNLLDPFTATTLGLPEPLWALLHVAGPQPSFGYVAYPLLPWLGVMSLGYWWGQAYGLPEPVRQRWTLVAGLAATTAFVVVRTLNGYGDPSPWSLQADPAFTALSFLNTTKYPPSLAYLLMTLGPMWLLLWALERWPSLEWKPLVIFGRVPLFAYVLHLVLAHAAAILTATWMGFDPTRLFELPFLFPEEWGVPLAGVYVAWGIVLVVLYPACLWFAGVKRRRTEWWIRYL